MKDYFIIAGGSTQTETTNALARLMANYTQETPRIGPIQGLKGVWAIMPGENIEAFRQAATEQFGGSINLALTPPAAAVEELQRIYSQRADAPTSVFDFDENVPG